LKTHAKISLVVREEGSDLRRYCHVATGNYNSDTARIYEDVGILSADPVLCADLSNLFNVLTGYSLQRDYQRLLVAPVTLRTTVIDLIDAQAHPGGRVVMKMNSLTDSLVMDALAGAAHAGADVDIIVRGICSLRPDVKGWSDGLRIRSIVGRFLEHSRIFRFGHAGAQATYLISSADMMRRNLERRVETAIPVISPQLRARLDEILEVNLADDALAWQLGSDGRWTKVVTREGVNAQKRLQQLAIERARVSH
jgi:polyphosphate kinase